jgi:hypothetical protein
LAQLELMTAPDHCSTCFAPFYRGRCERCLHRPIIIQRQIAACEQCGPAATLFKAFLQGRREVIPALASLMVYQWVEQKFPIPDLLITLPILGRSEGINRLADEIGALFSIPAAPLLKRRWDSSHFLALGGFKRSLSLAPGFQEHTFCDKKMLLIAPLLQDEEIRAAGQLLKLLFPKELAALAFAC